MASSSSKLSFDEIKEELNNDTMEKRAACCDICLYNEESKSGWSVVRAVRKEEGVYICYECELTLCGNCIDLECIISHKLCVRKGSEKRERVREGLINILMKEEGREDKLEEKNVCMYHIVKAKHELDEEDLFWITGFKCVCKESEERERVREGLINSFMKEEGREDKLEEENVCMYDRVNVKHELDKENCYITGLCGLDNRRWVACDYLNDCIKIFQCGSNVLLRYIRIGSKPGDVTEIQVKQNSTVPDSASSSSSDISVTDSTKPDKSSFLAVTLPWERHILFIDVNKTPAIKVKSIKMEKQCFRIEFCDDKIFTLCREEDPSLYGGSHWSVYVMSTDGVQLSTIQTGVFSRVWAWSDLAVVPGRFYVTDDWDHKVKCIHVDGRVISEITKERLWPRGISVDPDHNVYISAYDNNEIYKLDFDLDGPPRPLLLDQSTDYMESPATLCFYRDKLFISHGLSLRNIVSVVRLF